MRKSHCHREVLLQLHAEVFYHFPQISGEMILALILIQATNLEPVLLLQHHTHQGFQSLAHYLQHLSLQLN